MDKKSKNIIIVLGSLVGVLLLALVGILAYNYGKDKGSEGDDSQETTQVVDTVAVMPAPSLTSPAPAPEPVESYEQAVYGDLYGNVGGQYLSIFMINKSGNGYYETGGARRSLKVVSRANGRMEVKAYLRGKYIGKFKGSYSAYGDRLTLYTGTFYSSRGGGLSFELINPLD